MPKSFNFKRKKFYMHVTTKVFDLLLVGINLELGGGG